MISRWWFQTFFIFTPTCRRFPFWLIFFRWVETTNQIWLSHCKIPHFHPHLWAKALGTTKSTSQRPLDGRMFKSQGGEYGWKWTFGSFKLPIFGGIKQWKMYGNFEWFAYNNGTVWVTRNIWALFCAILVYLGHFLPIIVWVAIIEWPLMDAVLLACWSRVSGWVSGWIRWGVGWFSSTKFQVPIGSKEVSRQKSGGWNR